MVHGIETDSEIYKHKKKDDIKEMCEDMFVWKRYVQRDCHISGSRDLEKMNASENKKDNKR